MALNEWQTRKISIDAMYPIAAILGEVVLAYTKEILEVLNHCRFDKSKPVREAAIEAINLIKEIDPSANEENQSQDSHSRRDRASRGVPEKPWKKKKGNRREEESAPFNVHVNIDDDDDGQTKKVSAATLKRREAQEAKKRVQPVKKPNLNKEK